MGGETQGDVETVFPFPVSPCPFFGTSPGDCLLRRSHASERLELDQVPGRYCSRPSALFRPGSPPAAGGAAPKFPIRSRHCYRLLVLLVRLRPHRARLIPAQARGDIETMNAGTNLIAAATFTSSRTATQT